jgi:hypothetical protein
MSLALVDGLTLAYELAGAGVPVLAVLGGESDKLWARFGETHRRLLTSFRNGCRAGRRKPLDVDPGSRCGRLGTCLVLPAKKHPRPGVEPGMTER